MTCGTSEETNFGKSSSVKFFFQQETETLKSALIQMTLETKLFSWFSKPDLSVNK